MSLVNDMLKDLDKRQAPDQNPAPAVAGYGTLTQGGNNRTFTIAIVLLVGVLLIAGVVTAWLFKDKLLVIIESEKAQTSTVTEADNSSETSQVDVSMISPEKISTPNRLLQETKANKEPVSTKTSVIDEVAKGERPQASNEKDKEIEVKAVLQSAIANSQNASAAPVSDTEKAGNEEPVRAKKEDVVVTPEVIKAEVVAVDAEVQAVIESNASISEKMPATKSIKTKVVKTPEQIDGDVVAKATNYLRAGDKTQAMSLLQQHISVAPQHDLSSELMVMALIQSRQFVAANQLIEDFPVSHVSLAMQLKARVLLAQGKIEDAIGVLEQKLPELSEYPDHHVMLAAIYQQSGRYNDAASVYASLIAYDESVGNWWAGLGIALEGSNQLEGAKRAYQRALKLRSLNTDLANYVSSRLVQMNGS